jgi:hypothetical protein
MCISDRDVHLTRVAPQGLPLPKCLTVDYNQAGMSFRESLRKSQSLGLSAPVCGQLSSAQK